MNPIAFSIFGIDIRWYGIFIATGVLLSLWLAKYTSKLKNVDFDMLFNTFFIAFPIAVIGARLYYVIFNFQYYKDNLLSALNIREGGLAIHGGIIFGLVTAYIYIKNKKENFLKFADIAAPSLILAQGIGRWGNFFNSEAHGGPVSYEFIKHFPKFIQKGMFIDGVYYHPTFLYESLWNIFVCIVLIIILKKTLIEGITVFTYIGLYSLGRFFIEGLRTDSLMFGNMRVAQMVSILGILCWVFFLIYIRTKERRQN
ncbi:phosphatidylglycerol:prolipoprotein diacylglycerol transferase [Clostridium tetanomorphum]|uniref:Phosphatidylglycerol--prolipoprotein diacylglyceryl transferase n=1 Tax=Clostridium tetanomorphum TaxID=1553 RepID=A0A923EC29_CLOTT|nr:prolipoprotein diacylglyceryl transferase [Clostridium tetanomorphum]KAJ51198.1 prolipoprotein diacylglyceryl transferase [Clostridium tetanomorphum DSM 665]MBC2399021.1 prolipoprotein diacylglyceryl transferase [Clostridium tetanomorphum]MBP1862634.1 phosphatidylglycerol:prolipoprotein diacylglycerol transferase [Clostridium tetanomorphum]NRS85525.1 phosphatidylglycerol:prolipoprotein diacylglycerol transferase [Clostridium tetanomorphum]NRZ98639.1 phosphatidylglycerol:prolipoprotein diacy